MTTTPRTIHIQNPAAVDEAVHFILRRVVDKAQQAADDMIAYHGQAEVAELLGLAPDTDIDEIRWKATYNKVARLPGTRIAADLIGAPPTWVAACATQAWLDPFYRDLRLVVRAWNECPLDDGAESYATLRELEL